MKIPKLDVIYIVRPNVERWSDALLLAYSETLGAARRELERRKDE